MRPSTPFASTFCRGLYVAVGLGLIVGANSASADWLDDPRQRSLTRAHGAGSVALGYSFMKSDEGFGGNGALIGSAAQFNDHQLDMHLDYGVTDRLTVAFDVPLLYRLEERLLRADDFGIGDSRLTFLYRPFGADAAPFQAALLASVKMPSGDSDIQKLNIAGANDRELPLGSGQYDAGLGLQLRQIIGAWRLLGEADFTYRFPGLVEYLQATQTTAGGNVLVGNAEVSYGHRLHYALFTDLRLLQALRLGAAAHMLHVFEGEMDSYNINTTSLTKGSTTLPAGYLFSVTPQLQFLLDTHWSLLLQANLPLAGEDQPVIPLVESLIGNRYALRVTYEF